MDSTETGMLLALAVAAMILTGLVFYISGYTDASKKACSTLIENVSLQDFNKCIEELR